MEVILFIIFLGFLQGLTEFLPISSSGHLALMENIPFFHEFSHKIQTSFSLLAFNVILHIGTIVAVIYFWRKDILSLIKKSFQNLKEKNYKGEGIRILILIFLATLPVLSVPFYKDFVSATSESLILVSVFFIINGLFLIISDIFVIRKKKHHEHLKNLSEYQNKNAFIVGIFQCFAVLPGISRSGSTISAGLFTGLSGEESVRFSFLISIPVLTGAALLEGKEAFIDTQITNFRYDWAAIGIISSFLAGILSLKLLVWLGRKLIFYPFGIYTLILGIIVLLTT
ncbi:MAG: undecaprenyl-diphosphate phosphatase [Spirochaetia bacterium]|nr:undecaprenyl-diphosphate phosphatase [Spirochaetia bacterium]